MIIEPTLQGHFLNLYHMALTDADFDTSELQMLYQIGEEKGISKEEIVGVVIRPDAIKFTVPETILEKIESLYDFARIAWADGKIDQNENRLLQMFCLKFGFEAENVPAITQFLLDEAQKKTTKDDIFKIVSANL